MLTPQLFALPVETIAAVCASKEDVAMLQKVARNGKLGEIAIYVKDGPTKRIGGVTRLSLVKELRGRGFPRMASQVELAEVPPKHVLVFVDNVEADADPVPTNRVSVSAVTNLLGRAP